MIEIVYAARFIQQLREETGGARRQVPCTLPAEPCASGAVCREPPARRALRLARPLAAALGAIALAVIAVAR